MSQVIWVKQDRTKELTGSEEVYIFFRDDYTIIGQGVFNSEEEAIIFSENLETDKSVLVTKLLYVHG